MPILNPNNPSLSKILSSGSTILLSGESMTTPSSIFVVIRTVMSLPRDERWQYLKSLLWPYDERKYNVAMWSNLGASYLMSLVYFINIYVVSKVLPFIHLFYMILMSAYFIYEYNWYRWSEQHQQAMLIKRNKIINEGIQAVQQMVADHTNSMISSIKEASGREELHDNPITLAAATIEGMEQAQKSKLTDNPLKAALENDVHGLSDIIKRTRPPDEPSV